MAFSLAASEGPSADDLLDDPLDEPLDERFDDSLVPVRGRVRVSVVRVQV